MLRSIPKQNNDRYCGLTWFEMDTLRGGHDHIEHPHFIAVTEGPPGSTIRAAYEFARPRKSVQRLIDSGYLTFVRHETYPRGAQCDVYNLSNKGCEIVENFYASGHDDGGDNNTARINTAHLQRAAETRRQVLTMALDEQFGGNYHLSALYNEIAESKTPFLDLPLPSPSLGMDGTPISIREYLICCWWVVLPDDAAKLVKDFFMWADVLGEDEAMKLMKDRSGEDDEPPSSTYGNIGWKDDQDE